LSYPADSLTDLPKDHLALKSKIGVVLSQDRRLKSEIPKKIIGMF